MTDINIQNVKGVNALFLSLIHGMYAVTFELLDDSRINKKLRDNFENTLLGIATCSPQEVFDVIFYLDIENLNTLNENGKSPVYMSIYNNNYYVLINLINLINSQI